MNLWVRRTGQLFLAALFMMSCEDDSFLLGFRDQNKKFNVTFLEIPVGEGTVRADSMITDNLDGIQRLLVGEYFDTEVGTVRTEAYAEFLPFPSSKLNVSPSLEYKYDSVVFEMRLDGYSYGLAGEESFKFKIHQITGDTLTYKNYVVTTTDTLLYLNRYFANSNSEVEYDESKYLGEAQPYDRQTVNGKVKYTPTNLKLSKLEATNDSIFTVMRTRLDAEGDLKEEVISFGELLFEVALNDNNSEFSDNEKFRSNYKGLALIPSSGDAVVGLSISTTFSKVRMHYHTTDAGVTKDTLYRDFLFTGVSFHSIEANRPGDLPTTEQPFTPGVDLIGGKRVVQSGAPLLTKIDLNPFYAFADTVDAEQIMINSAELIIESVPSPEGYKPIANLELRIMDEDDTYLDRRVDEDSTAMSGYNVMTDGLGYYVGADLSQSSAYLTYSKSKERYSGFSTLFFQSLFDKRNREDSPRLRYLGLFPATSVTGVSSAAAGKSINRSIFNKENIKLRIYYTSPNKPNL